jgi:catechol 2,3-dioxygenase-like lactoylglutathione lyase family enzyme
MVKELRIALTVENFEEAVAFYRDTLGMEMLEMWNAPGANGVLLDAGRATLELFDAGQAAAVDEIEVGRRVSGPVRFAIRVDDSAAVADELVLAGAQRENEPVEPPWGGVNVRVQAPDGMQLTLFSAAHE